MKEFKLDNEPKIASGFKAPNAYFDGLQSKVTERIPEKKAPVIVLFSKRKNWVFAVAAVFIIALTIPLLYYFNKPVSEIDTTSIENYLVNHAAISDDDIAELLNEEDIQQIKVATTTDEKDLEEVLTANSNLEDYLN